jgi:hypothetical protein
MTCADTAVRNIYFFKSTRLDSSLSIMTGRPRIRGLISASGNVLHALICIQRTPDAPTSKLNFPGSIKWKNCIITSPLSDDIHGTLSLLLMTNSYINICIYKKHTRVYMHIYLGLYIDIYCIYIYCIYIYIPDFLNWNYAIISHVCTLYEEPKCWIE